jgi:hypothetical protein
MKTISKDDDGYNWLQDLRDVEKEEITEHQWDLWVSLKLHYFLPVALRKMMMELHA